MHYIAMMQAQQDGMINSMLHRSHVESLCLYLRSYTVPPPRGTCDIPEICPLTVCLYSSVYYVNRTIRLKDAESYGAS